MTEGKVRRVLVASDLSDCASEAVRMADAYAQAVGGTLGVCHVLPDAGVHMLFPQRYGPEAVEHAALSQRASDLVADSVSTITGRPRTSLEIFIDQGVDYAEIVRRAEAWGASVLFVGSHGHSAIARMLLGSVADRVVRHAPCSVLVARRSDHTKVVLAATDLSPPSLRALPVAADEARRRGAELVVLHVVDHGVPLGSVGPSLGMTPLLLSPEMLRDICRAAQARIEAVLAKEGAHAEVLVVEGLAGPTILEYAEERRPELVVVATHGRTGLARLALGSVAEHVARGAKASVLVVRQASSPAESPAGA